MGILKERRGGKRPGAGRTSSGYIPRRVSLSMPPEFWGLVDQLKEKEVYASDSEVLREAFQMAFYDLAKQLGEVNIAERISEAVKIDFEVR